MGRDKAWLPHGAGTLCEHQLATLSQIGPAHIYLSARPGSGLERFGYPLLVDDVPGLGPLGGIAKALTASPTGLLLVLAVDMPRMSAAYLELLLLACAEGCGVVPRWGEHFEPLAAVYPRATLSLAAQRLQSRHLGLQPFVQDCVDHQLLAPLRVRESESGLFENWNTPEDLR